MYSLDCLQERRHRLGSQYNVKYVQNLLLARCGSSGPAIDFDTLETPVWHRRLRYLLVYFLCKNKIQLTSQAAPKIQECMGVMPVLKRKNSPVGWGACSHYITFESVLHAPAYTLISPFPWQLTKIHFHCRVLLRRHLYMNDPTFKYSPRIVCIFTVSLICAYQVRAKLHLNCW